MSRLNRVYFLLLLGIASGCATLKVNVDVYKPPLPDSPAAVTRLADQVLVDSVFVPSANRAAYQELLEKVRADYFDRVKATTPAGIDPKAAAETLWPATKTNIDSAWNMLAEKADDVYFAALAVDQEGLTAEGKLTYPEKLTSLRKAVVAHSIQYSTFRGQLCKALDVLCQEKYPTLLLADATLGPRGIAASAEISGPAVGAPIFDDRIGALSASDDHWSRFSSATFTSSGGNSQFVVVREGLVVFRQKSLDFDPTSAVGAGTALTRLGLQVAAAMATGKAVTQKEGSKTEVNTTALMNEAELESNKDLLEQRTKARRALLLDLAKILEDTQAAETQPTDDKIKGLRTRFESVITFFQGQSTKPEGSK